MDRCINCAHRLLSLVWEADEKQFLKNAKTILTMAELSYEVWVDLEYAYKLKEICGHLRNKLNFSENFAPQRRKIVEHLRLEAWRIGDIIHKADQERITEELQRIEREKLVA